MALQGDSLRTNFVNLLKEHPVLLKKSMLPKVVSEKEVVWQQFAEEYSKIVGKLISVNQLKKMLNNMKTAVKKKSDATATGNKRIKLSEWESDLLHIFDHEENPVFSKIKNSVSVGLNEDISKDELEGSSSSGTPSTPRTPSTPALKPKKRLRFETEETESLSNSQLQRLVLLQQLELSRAQLENAKLLKQQLLHKKDAEAENNILTEIGDYIHLDQVIGKPFLLPSSLLYIIIKNCNL